MNRRLCFAGFLALPFLLSVGCGSTAPALTLDLGVDKTIRIGQDALVNGASATVRLEAVLEDSRCPIDAVCISAGRIRVRVRVTTLKGSFTQEASLPPPDVSVEPPSGYAVALTDAAPSARAAQTIPEGDYRLTVKVTKAP